MKLKTIDLKVKDEKYYSSFTLTLDISENTDEEKINFLNNMFKEHHFRVSKIKNHVHLTYETYEKNTMTPDEVKEFLENITYAYMVMISNKNEMSEILSDFYLKYNEFA